MQSKLEHTPNEARLWKAQNFIKRLIAWTVLIVCAPMTIYLGIQGIAAFMNGLRDWWHYVERSPNPDGWFYFLLFFAAGIGWLFSYHYLDDPKGESQRFDEYIRRKRTQTELWEKERTRERTRWDKIKDRIGLAYLVMMAGGLLALLVKNIFW